MSSARAGEVTEEQRNDVRKGIQSYEQGDAQVALRLWIPVYESLDRTQRFRLAFNIARAEDKLAQESEAAFYYEEFLEGFRDVKSLDGADKARLEEEATRANSRLLALRRQLARVAFADGTYTVRMGERTFAPRQFVYLRPEMVRLVFSNEDKVLDDRSVLLHAGESRLIGPEREVRLQSSPPNLLAPTPGSIELRSGAPFPPVLLVVGAGLTAATVALPVLTYIDGSNYQQAHPLSSNVADADRNQTIQAHYASLETRHYLALSVPITLGVATGALALWYALAPRKKVVIEGAMLRF